MQELSLAFVGGCLTHQPGIPFPRLFHRVLSRRLQAHYGRQLKMVVAPRYLDDPHRRLESILEKGPVDAVVLHRSTMTFFRKTGLIIGGRILSLRAASIFLPARGVDVGRVGGHTFCRMHDAVAQENGGRNARGSLSAGAGTGTA